MKKGIIISIAAAGLLGSMGLQASGEVPGEAAAKAKVEEVTSKEAFKAKEDMDKFKKEAAENVKKVDDVEKVKELEAKDKAAAAGKADAFKKEATEDVKKLSH
jgi:hypothetical protein